MNAREQRGLEIVANSLITREGNRWLVPSQSNSKRYVVDLFLNTCTCLDFVENGQQKCKHLYAVEFLLQRESGVELPEPTPRKKYRQEWDKYNLAQTTEKARFLELLYELCAGVNEPVQKMGRPRMDFSDMVFCAAYKVYSTFPSRRFTSDLHIARERGYIARTPHFNTVCKYLDLPEMTPYLRQLIVESSLPLKTIEWDFAVDSSGFSTGQTVSWSSVKYGGTTTIDKADWLKVHLMCGVKTNIVTSVEVSDRNAGDNPYFAPLVNATAHNFPIQSICADKAYSAEKNLKLVLLKGGQPYIDFRKNATARNRRSGQVWKRMFLYYQMNQEWFMNHYHKRSNVESTFSMIKAKFGEQLRSKSQMGQVNELLCKILCHNLCCLIQSIYELGIEPTFWND